MMDNRGIRGVSVLMLGLCLFGCDGFGDTAKLSIEGDCSGGPSPGVVSAWVECGEFSLADGPVPVFLTNDTGESAWHRDDCSSPALVVERLEDTGEWARTLTLPVIPVWCPYWSPVPPGTTVAVETLELQVQELGWHRASFAVGWNCVPGSVMLGEDPHCDPTERTWTQSFEVVP